MRTRIATLALTGAAAALVAGTLGPKPAPRFVWNASESVPKGLYRVQPPRRLIVTDLVVAFPPEPLATLLAEGGYGESVRAPIALHITYNFITAILP